MKDLHRLTDQVIGIYAHPEGVTRDLRAAGYDTEVISGEEGHRHLDPTGRQHGIGAKLLRVAAILGDERRILDRFDDAVERGEAVVSVQTDEDDPAAAIEIMKRHGGRFIWRFEAGTHLQLTD